jgi:hypothetical protein
MMNKSKNIIKDLYEDPVEGFVGIVLYKKN